MLRKPRGEILIDESCKIAKSDAGTTFEIATSKKTYYLTADSVTAVEDWLKALQVYICNEIERLRVRCLCIRIRCVR